MCLAYSAMIWGVRLIFCTDVLVLRSASLPVRLSAPSEPGGSRSYFGPAAIARRTLVWVSH